MCGFFEFNNHSPQGENLIRSLEIDEQSDLFRTNSGSGPASVVDIVLSAGGRRSVVPAVWWLLLDRQTLKPSRYTSFNTRSDKLNVRNSAGYQSYRHQRCIVPATGIVEGDGPKGLRRYHLIEPESTGFALGGLYREWVSSETGEHAYSCSIITLPPHPEWQNIHSQSTPLFLPHDDPEMIERWLDPHCDSVGQFDELLNPVFRDRLSVTPVDRPSSRVPTGTTFLI